MLPDNIGVAVDFKNERQKASVLESLRHPSDLKGNLQRLGTHWRIQVSFSDPVHIQVNRRKSVDTDRYVFPGFFKSKIGDLCYTTARRRRAAWSGYRFEWPFLDKVVAYNLVDSARTDEFSSLDQFAKRFDRRFISREVIESLWNEKSGQHGGKYNKRDFHRLGSKGRYAVDMFMYHFKGVGVTVPPPGYMMSNMSKNHILRVYHRATSNSGRDITISHQLGRGDVHYASEFVNSGNGRYGLLVSEKTFLWLEDD